MNKAKRPCRQPGCVNLVDFGYCDEHKEMRWVSVTNLRALDSKKDPKEVKFYSSPAWRRTSKLYRLKHPLCERCEQRGLYKKSELVHHMKEVRDIWKDGGNPLQWKYLQAICTNCHLEDLRAKKKNKNKNEYKY